MKSNAPFASALLGLALLLPAPAAAQTVLLVIPMSAASQASAPKPARTLEQRVVAAAEAACGRPFLRDLRGIELHRACVAQTYADLAVRYLPGQSIQVASSR